MLSQIIADTGLDFFANFTGANSASPNLSSACIPLGIAPGGIVAITPCSTEENFPPFSSKMTLSTTQLQSSGGEVAKTNSKMTDQHNTYHRKLL